MIINSLTHNLLMDTVQYMDYLDSARQKCMRDFYEYTRRLDEQRARYKMLRDEDYASQPDYCITINNKSNDGFDGESI